MLYLIDCFTRGSSVILLLYNDESADFLTIQDEGYKPYFLVSPELSSREEEAIRRFNCEVNMIEKIDLFTHERRRMLKVKFEDPSLLTFARRFFRERWEDNIPYPLSYVYDQNMLFGVPYEIKGDSLKPLEKINPDLDAAFQERFTSLRKIDPEKFQVLSEWFRICSQPIPEIPVDKLGGHVSSDREGLYLSFILSRIANLPLSTALTDRHVSIWIKSILHFYLRRKNILIPRARELMRDEKPRRITGALTFPPRPGTYFNTVVVDFESLYPSIIDAYNLSYETVNCGHSECRENVVPETNNYVCKLRRGVYSILIGALKDLRIRWFKQIARDPSVPEEERRPADAASRLLKLILVSCYGVTVRTPGLSQPALAESITAYGRYALKRTWSIAENLGLKPLYGDTDSLFLDDPKSEQVDNLIMEVKRKLRLDLAVDKVFSICVLPRAMKTYFGIRKDGTPEIKGAVAIKSNSPLFIRRIFMECIAELAKVRNHREFDEAKRKIQDIVHRAIERLKAGMIPIDELAYNVRLHESALFKAANDEAMSQPYQCARQLLDRGVEVKPGSVVSFVKVKPFLYGGKRYTVKPLSLVRSMNEVNIEDYVRSLKSALTQAFKPMKISFDEQHKMTLADFI
ncbi:hypothetical protein J7L18_09615 [Candidatus Bathyarchaeota archaeon]|nr:hypothetical protein [Candidatus Bathyarchaeota archaeon]